MKLLYFMLLVCLASAGTFDFHIIEWEGENCTEPIKNTLKFDGIMTDFCLPYVGGNSYMCQWEVEREYLKCGRYNTLDCSGPAEEKVFSDECDDNNMSAEFIFPEDLLGSAPALYISLCVMLFVSMLL